jgi:hypothetical protein
MNLTAKIKEKNQLKLLDAIENKYNRIITKSQSKDIVNKMIEVMNESKELKRKGIIKSIDPSPDKARDFNNMIYTLNTSQNMTERNSAAVITVRTEDLDENEQIFRKMKS